VVPEAEDLDDAAWSELESIVETSLESRPSALKRRLRLFLRLVQWLPLLRYGRPFTSLDPKHRTRFLAGLQNTQIDLIRVGFWGLRTLAFLGYYGRPNATRAIGYRPELTGWGTV
jgi:hypothetical protein